MANNKDTSPTIVEPPLTSLGWSTSLTLFAGRVAVEYAGKIGFTSAIPENINTGITLSLALMTFALLIKDIHANAIKIYPILSGVGLGLAIGIALENLPQVALPIGIFSVGFFGICYGLDNHDVKK